MSSEPERGDIAISLNGAGKCYEIYDRPQHRLWQTLLRGRKRFYREFWALRGIDLEVEKGESVGIVGRNGSGKSTLLQLVAGTVRPTEGELVVEGRIGALLELGSGFNTEYTGRENVFMLGSILGLQKKEVEERFDDIAAFADIGDFLDQPVKTYSSGMFVRLAFAVQAQLQPDILIVDEALAVGDALFQRRCYEKLEQLRSEGVTFLFVSHDQEAVRTLTNRAVLLERGKALAIGAPADVLLEYRRLLHEQETRYYGEAVRQRSRAVVESEALRRLSFGDLDAEIESVEIFDAEGEPASAFRPGDVIHIRVLTKVNRPSGHLNISLRLRSKEGIKIYSWGTFNQDLDIWGDTPEGEKETLWERSFEAGEVIVVDFEFECRLGANWYEVQAGVSEEAERRYGSQRMLHWREECAFFQVAVPLKEHFFGGACDLQMRANVST